MDGIEPGDRVVRELDVFLSNGQLGQNTKVHPSYSLSCQSYSLR
jgi:hypothetical protein